MDYIILSITLLAIGIYGLLTQRHMLKILVSIELVATGASINFVLLTSGINKSLGEAFLVLAFSTDTCVAAIILALLVVISKKYGTLDIGELVKLEKSKETDIAIEDSEETKEAGN